GALDALYKANEEVKGNVLVVVPDLYGHPLADEIRVIYGNLAGLLCREEHNVTMLLTGREGISKMRNAWRSKLETHPGHTKPHVVNLKDARGVGNLGPSACMSFTIMQWLLASKKNSRFDAIHFADFKGLGYYTMLAKQLKLGLQNSYIVVHAHGPSAWIADHIRGEFAIDTVEMDFLERKSTALADHVISSSQYMLDWCVEDGFRFPPHTFVLQDILPKKKELEVEVQPSTRSAPIRSLVVLLSYNALQESELICDALDIVYDRLAADAEAMDPPRRPRAMHLRFIHLVDEVHNEGDEESSAADDGTSKFTILLHRRSEAWATWILEVQLGNPITYYHHLLQGHQAKYGGLAGANATWGSMLAVMPLVFGNTPMAALETIEAGLPIILTDVGGVKELLDDASTVPKEVVGLADKKVMSSGIVVKPAAKALAWAIGEACKQGVPLARTMIRPIISYRTRNQYYDTMFLRNSMKRPPETMGQRPLVSAILVHRNAPGMAQAALNSILNQTYRELEVVLVDDASTDRAAAKWVDFIEGQWIEDRVAGKVVRIRRELWEEGEADIAAALNAGAAVARGTYLFFMDMRHMAKRYEIGALVRVIQSAGVDVLCPFGDIYDLEQGVPKMKINTAPDIGYLGGAIGPGVVRNVYGALNFLVPRDIYAKVGGFPHARGDVSRQDAAHDFLGAAALEGYNVVPFPSSTFWMLRDEQGSERDGVISSSFKAGAFEGENAMFRFAKSAADPAKPALGAGPDRGEGHRSVSRKPAHGAHARQSKMIISGN
ncbi:hypothetical protein CYMTET_52046, partial [Cymbomonas tetramitiformis]